ncbi:MAG: type II toxin-antitoxin system HicB family antitoxin [Candidatus Aquicultor sp.]
MRIGVVLHPDLEGGYTVTVPSLPGCISEGDTVEEALENIKEAIKLFIESMREHGEELPEEADDIFTAVEIEVA